MNKMDFINSYISKCDEAIASGNLSAADKLQDEIIAVFEAEIPDIKNMLDNYGFSSYDSGRQVDFIGDIKLVKQKLVNYLFNIQQKQEKMKYDLELARLKQPQLSAHAEANPTQTTTQTATQTANINITIDQTLKRLDEISEENLSTTDKDALKDLIFSLEGCKAAKDTNKFWSKTKEVLKFIADKGADAAIATLPYIIAGLQGINV